MTGDSALCRHKKPDHPKTQRLARRDRHNANIGIIMEPDPWKLVALHSPVELAGEHIGDVRPAVTVTEHEVFICVVRTEQQSLGSLRCAP